jgi:hypothetical protein
MSKQEKQVPAKPKVTQIPLPISESALVIDLPDGQKLVVGKMTHGTVIDVATWRGTGRPDSRTNRMMLGMSNTEIETQIEEEEERQATQAVSGWRGQVQVALGIARTIPGRAKGAVQKVSSKIGRSKSASESSESAPAFKSLPFQSKSDSVQQIDDDIQAWLDKVTAKSAKKSAKSLPAPKSSSVAKKTPARKAKPTKK